LGQGRWDFRSFDFGLKFVFDLSFLSFLVNRVGSLNGIVAIVALVLIELVAPAYFGMNLSVDKRGCRRVKTLCVVAY
jgi:hypothetical protein